MSLGTEFVNAKGFCLHYCTINSAAKEDYNRFKTTMKEHLSKLSRGCDRKKFFEKYLDTYRTLCFPIGNMDKSFYKTAELPNGLFMVQPKNFSAQNKAGLFSVLEGESVTIEYELKGDINSFVILMEPIYYCPKATRERIEKAMEQVVRQMVYLLKRTENLESDEFIEEFLPLGDRLRELRAEILWHEPSLTQITVDIHEDEDELWTVFLSSAPGGSMLIEISAGQERIERLRAYSF